MVRHISFSTHPRSGGSSLLSSTDPRHLKRDSVEFWNSAIVIVLVILILLLLPLLIGNQQEGSKPVVANEDPPPRPTATQPTDTTLEKLFPEVKRDTEGKLHWPRPRVSERQNERDRLVERHIARGGAFHSAVTNPRVLAALRAVPRHEFVPSARQRSAYNDTPLPIGHGQTISQPYIVALMTELLAVEPGQKVLEVGTGSGYQAAVLSELTPYVYSIEIVKPLHEEVAERYKRLGYKTIKTRFGDGYDGWEEHAPFDSIIVTCVAGHVPPPLWEQLKPGGRMVIPLGGVYSTQRLLVLTKQADGSRTSRNVLPVRFVPMTGQIQKP